MTEPYSMSQSAFRNANPHLTDATALTFDAAPLYVILVDLIREEGVEDLVHQLGGGGFGGPFAVLLDLGGVSNGLSSGSSPVGREPSRWSDVGRPQQWSGWRGHLVISFSLQQPQQQW